MISIQSLLYKLYLVIIKLAFSVFNNISTRHFLPSFPSSFFEKGRMLLLRMQGLSSGSQAFIRTGFWSTNPRNISLGQRGTIAINCQFYSYDKIQIGDDFLIGSDVIIHTAEHVYGQRDKPFIEQGSIYKPVSIGNNVYIGSRVIILAGAIIEDNVIVAAGSIVSTRLESGYIYAGAPAKKIKPIFGE